MTPNVIDILSGKSSSTYFYDSKRHLVCVPYSIANLHKMARTIGINRCWFHNAKYPHYDIPKKMIDKMDQYAIEVSAKEILMICKGKYRE